MRRGVSALLALATVALLAPVPAAAEFGLKNFHVTFKDAEAGIATQAGSHPFEVVTSFEVNTREEGGGEYVDGAVRNIDFDQAVGLVGNPTVVPRCSTLDFLTMERVKGIPVTRCADSSAVGYVSNVLGSGGVPDPAVPFPVYSLEPVPGVAARLGFWVANVPVTVELGLRQAPPYNVVGRVINASSAVEVFGSELVLWGNPADDAHDELRGRCIGGLAETCPADLAVRPFVTMPRSCEGPLVTTFKATSWWSGSPLFPGPPAVSEGKAESAGTRGCGKLGFGPQLDAQPTTARVESPTGLNVSLQIDDEGISDPQGSAHSDIRKAVVTLPEGMTANPSLAEGLAACSVEDLRRETLSSQPGEGCPQASKIGTAEVESPLLEDELLRGALFIATPDAPGAPGAENPFDSLIALYLVVKDPELGILVKLPGKVEPNPQTGQLVTTFDDLPQLPVSDFRLRFREGGRSPLISPPRCGTHTTVAEFTPWANPGQVLHRASSFEITAGVDGSPCPAEGSSPFAPGFTAGTLNNNAGSFSPLYMRLTRRDGDQDLTRFSAKLPPGLTARLAGVAQCPDAAIAAARGRRGREEQATPSCPADSQIGAVIGGAGVGSQLTYVPGKLYLAGPVGGAPLSAVAIVPAVAGPFDVGTVVVRQALQVNPRTGEVRVDSSASDPIPHILAGIPLRVRDVRVHADRPKFTLNPTSCNPFEIGAEIWGGGSNPFSAVDDAPVALAERFQAANCARLGFKPTLSLRLKGGTKRGDHPALRSVYTPKRGHANLSDLVLRLPRSAFLDQAHIRTICTRVQFAARRCPKGAIYGHAKAFTPLLEKPLKGPVYLRSSNNELPDLVADLRGIVAVEVVARIDSRNGGIRATFKKVPDAPVSRAIFSFPGGSKGLIVNSRDLCLQSSRAALELEAQNGKTRALRPLVRARCRK